MANTALRPGSELFNLLSGTAAAANNIFVRASLAAQEFFTAEAQAAVLHKALTAAPRNASLVRVAIIET